jgi:hypothetical protein
MYEDFVDFCNDENCEYLRFLSEFSSLGSVLSLSYKLKSNQEKNSDMNFASISLSFLIL